MWTRVLYSNENATSNSGKRAIINLKKSKLIPNDMSESQYLSRFAKMKNRHRLGWFSNIIRLYFQATNTSMPVNEGSSTLAIADNSIQYDAIDGLEVIVLADRWKRNQEARRKLREDATKQNRTTATQSSKESISDRMKENNSKSTGVTLPATQHVGAGEDSDKGAPWKTHSQSKQFGCFTWTYYQQCDECSQMP